MATERRLGERGLGLEKLIRLQDNAKSRPPVTLGVKTAGTLGSII